MNEQSTIPQSRIVTECNENFLCVVTFIPKEFANFGTYLHTYVCLTTINEKHIKILSLKQFIRFEDSWFISKQTRLEILSRPQAPKIPKELLSNSEELESQADQAALKGSKGFQSIQRIQMQKEPAETAYRDSLRRQPAEKACKDKPQKTA